MLRLGFIGAGGYGRIQIDGFLRLQAEGLVKITALADPSPTVLDALAAVPGLKTVRCFTDYQDLLAFGELDAVAICAPISLHEEMTLAALAKDLFILLEKPPVPLLSQLDRLIAADRNNRVMVGFQHIYSDQIQDLKRRLIAGSIGQILSISTHGLWPRPTSYYQRARWAGQLFWQGRVVLDGPCTNAFAHFINILLYLAGEEQDKFAMPLQLAGEAYRARPGLPTYDTGCLTGTTQRDISFFIGFSHASPELLPVEMRIHGTTGDFHLSNNCESVRSGSAEVIRGNEGQENLRRAFIAFAGGDASRNKTQLSAMKPYLFATNLMLASSAGIHDIAEKYVRVVREEDCVFAIENLAETLARSADNIIPLRQAGAPWAQQSSVLSATNFSEPDLIAMLRTPAAASAASLA